MAIKKNFMAVVIGCYVGSASSVTLECVSSGGVSAKSFELFQIAADGTRPHENGLLNLPQHDDRYDWSRHARANLWNSKGNANHIAGWLHVAYAANTLRPIINATFQLRNHQLWVHSASNGWYLKGQDDIEGYTWNLKNGDARDVPNRSYVNGTYQADVDYPLAFHGWGRTPQVAYDTGLPDDLDGILVLFEARSLNSKSLLVGVGADYYDKDNAYQGDAGIGQFKYLTKDWKLYGFTTASVTALVKLC